MLSIENLRTVFGSCPETCLVLYPDAPRFTIAYANQNYLQATNRTAEEIMGRGIFEAFPETNGESEKVSDIKSSLELVLTSKVANKSSLFRFNISDSASRVDEPHFWISDTYPLINEFGSIEYIVRSPINVTQCISEAGKGTQQVKFLTKDSDNPLFQDNPDAVFTLDLQGKFLSANKHLVEIAGYDEAALLQMSFHQFIEQGDLELVMSHFEKATLGEIQQFDARVVAATGKRYILDITYLPININGEVVGIYIIAKDVTSIRKAEQQIESYNQRVFNILESITDGFLTIDRNFTVTYWNKEAERILCKSREEVIGKNLWVLYPDAVHQKFYSEYHRALADNTSVQFQEYLEVMNCWLEVTAYPSEDRLSVFFKDITRRIKAEEEVQQAKEQYQHLFDFSPLPKWVFDVETLAFLNVNKAAIDHYGYTREEFLSMTLKDVRPAEGIPKLMEIINYEIIPDITLGPAVHHCNASVHKKKSGELMNVEVKGSTIFFQGRQARLAVIIDVTDRLKSAHELSVSEKRFKALVQEGSDMIHIIDAQGCYTYVSPNSRRVLNQVFEIGDKAFSTVLEPERQSMIDILATLKPGDCIKPQPIRYIDMNNEVQWLEITLTNLMDDPAVRGIVTNSRNVTEKIKSELKIKESVERFEIVSQATSDAIYEWNLSASYLKWNKGFELLFGHDVSYSDDNERWFKMLHPEDKGAVLQHMNSIIKVREPKVTLEYRFQCADGSYKHVLDRGYLIYNESGAPVRIIGAIQDVTDRINYIHRLEENNRRLSEISWLQSHVVRAPLAQIMGLAELISVDEADEEKKRLLCHLADSARELDQVVRNIIRKTERM